MVLLYRMDRHMAMEGVLVFGIMANYLNALFKTTAEARTVIIVRGEEYMLAMAQWFSTAEFQKTQPRQVVAYMRTIQLFQIV